MKVHSRGGVGVFTDYRENIVVDCDNSVLRWKASSSKLRRDWFHSEVQKAFPEGLPQIASENSEDALSWNVFRSLHFAKKLQLILDLVAIDTEVEAIYFWGRDPDKESPETDREIQQALNEMEPWGRIGRRQQTETDVILRGRRHLIMVESKLGEPSKKIRAWSRGRPGVPPDYIHFVQGMQRKLFTDQFDYNRDGNRFYQLFRNYILGAALSERWNIEFSLAAIVNSLNTNSNGRTHEEEFRAFKSLLIEPANAVFLSWQQVWESLRDEPELASLQEWLLRNPCLNPSKVEPQAQGK